MKTLPTRPWPIAATNKTNKAAGFTLIEIIATVVILALGSTLVVVYLDAHLPRSRMQAAARNLGATIGECRSFAITQGYAYEMEYDIDSDRYRILTPFQVDGGLAKKPENRLALDWVYMPESVDLRSVTIGGGQSMERGLVFVIFDPLGSSIAHQVYLYRETPQTHYTLRVDGLTGLLRFAEGLPEQEIIDEADFKY